MKYSLFVQCTSRMQDFSKEALNGKYRNHCDLKEEKKKSIFEKKGNILPREN
jgi:hypothetical protein